MHPLFKSIATLPLLMLLPAGSAQANGLTATAGATWTPCAEERAQCQFSGRRKVRFGAGSAGWSIRVHEDGVNCSNGVFGDPALGVEKRCEVESVTTREPLSGVPSAIEPAGPRVAPMSRSSPLPKAAGGVPTPAESAKYPIVGPIIAVEGQVIERVRVRSSSGPCIVVAVNDVTIRNAEIGPCGPGEEGKGVDVRPEATRLTVQRNYFHDMSTALYVDGGRHPIIFDRNYVTNIRGPMPRGQMVQFNGVDAGKSGSKITCNVSDTLRAAHSNVEDHINMFNSPGLAKDPTEIAYNRLRGGHPVSNSGTAIVVGDGDAGGNAWVHDNIVVHVRNVGIGVAGGVNVTVENNRIVMDKAVTYSNVGLYVWNQGKGACSGHAVRNNRVWVASSKGEQNPWWNNGNCGAVEVSGNTFGDESLRASIFEEVPAVCR